MQKLLKSEAEMNYNITVLDGDGIGPEICAGAIRVLNAIGAKYGHTFNFTHKDDWKL